MIERLFNNHQEMLNELVDTIARDISTSIKESGETSLAVSGGTTPVNLYDGLSLVDLSWHNVTITLTDERWVPVDHTASNERMVRQHLLQNSAQGARFISLKTHHPSAEKAEAELEKYLQNELPSLDLVILGMGADGHFASLFPHSRCFSKRVGSKQFQAVPGDLCSVRAKGANISYSSQNSNSKENLSANDR